MDRRRLVLTTSSAAALSTAAALAPRTAEGQALRSRAPEYVGAMTVVRRSLQWVRQEVARLMDAQQRDDEEWRIDVLAPFAAVEALRDASRAIIPPAKYATTHDRWLEALDELVAAGLHLRSGVLADNERSVALATRAMERAGELLDELSPLLPRSVARTP
ncbi:MAG TPA: hypothetical protein VEZ12_03370 [Herpetosiphonaceae bacterium]|nr:hypothetical protein [Herpetosiphonaceae bacterium]